jgi:hypothetical protein
MTRSFIVRSACEGLAAGAARREQAFALGRWREWREAIRRSVIQEMGDMPFAEKRSPLKSTGHTPQAALLRSGKPPVRILSRVQSTLLSFAQKESYPPPGLRSSSRWAQRQKPSQISAAGAVFCRCGYAAILFDPPGLAGEKGGRNTTLSTASAAI